MNIDLRAPRLTDRLLTEDLPCVIEAVEDELEYLTGAISANASHPQLLERFKTKQARLQRGRDWLRGKVAAELNRRAAGETEEGADGATPE